MDDSGGKPTVQAGGVPELCEYTGYERLASFFLFCYFCDYETMMMVHSVLSYKMLDSRMASKPRNRSRVWDTVLMSFFYSAFSTL